MSNECKSHLNKSLIRDTTDDIIVCSCIRSRNPSADNIVHCCNLYLYSDADIFDTIMVKVTKLRMTPRADKTVQNNIMVYHFPRLFGQHSKLKMKFCYSFKMILRERIRNMFYWFSRFRGMHLVLGSMTLIVYHIIVQYGSLIALGLDCNIVSRAKTTLHWTTIEGRCYSDDV